MICARLTPPERTLLDWSSQRRSDDGIHKTLSCNSHKNFLVTVSSNSQLFLKAFLARQR
jgi:hypothetical protein